MEIKIRYYYSNGQYWFSREFSLTEVENGYPYEVLSDSPLYRDYKFKDHVLFSGLKDKQEVEIYENDIVEIRHLGKLEKVKIIFHQGMFCFKWKDGYVNSYMINSENCRVVGNTYENSDLLK